MTSAKDLLILLTNDDGARALGIIALKEELSALGEVVVVAPSEERSAVSHGLTIHHPIRVIELSGNHYALTGNPADCVIFAVRKLLRRMPDIVVSGINHGPNLGDDVLYSGTVAGAREAALYGIPSMAVSLAALQASPDFKPAAGFVRQLIREFYPERFLAGTFLNVNVPEGEIKEYRFTRQGTKVADSAIEEKHDPRGRKYYWIGRDESEWVIEADTDYHAIQDKVVSITPLHHDQTDYRSLKEYTEKQERMHIVE
ncbi:MAG: 5'/3'-nucleotidase SurE [Acidobacteriota bacterium]